MRCALNGVAIGTYGSINLDSYRGASSKHEESRGSLVEGE